MDGEDGERNSQVGVLKVDGGSGAVAEVDCRIAEELDGIRRSGRWGRTEAVLAQQVHAPLNGHPGRLVLMEQIAPEKNQIRFQSLAVVQNLLKSDETIIRCNLQETQLQQHYKT